MELNLITRYYKNDGTFLISTKSVLGLPYEGGEVVVSGNSIKSLGKSQTITTDLLIEKNAIADYVIVELNIFNKVATKNGWQDFVDGASYFYTMLQSDIAGFDKDTFVKTLFEKVELSVMSSQILNINQEKKYTLIEFVEKALNDYNVNRRNKITLNGELKAILSVDAKESEWTGYDFRELVIRACKYVNVVPYLNASNELNYVKTPTYGELLEIENFEEYEDTQEDENFYDTVMSDSKNLVSDKDFTKERVLIGSASNDFFTI